MKFKRRNHRLLERLDPTPMTDVIFNLVIFFMIGASFGLPQAINVKLPSTQTAEMALEKDIVVTIEKEGKVSLNNIGVSLEDFDERLRAKLRSRKDKTVIVRADKEARHGIVVEIMDRAKLAGAEKLAIATDRRQSSLEK